MGVMLEHVSSAKEATERCILLKSLACKKNLFGYYNSSSDSVIPDQSTKVSPPLLLLKNRFLEHSQLFDENLSITLEQAKEDLVKNFADLIILISVCKVQNGLIEID